MRSVRLLNVICFCFLIQNLSAQDSTAQSNISQIPSKYFETVSKKANDLEKALDKKSQNVLGQLQKTEMRLRRKLAKIDSLAASNIFSNSAEKYNELQQKLKNKAGQLSQYIPKLDSLSTSIKFLEQHPEFINDIKDAKDKLADVSGKLKEFQSKLQGAEDIKKFLKERKEYLRQQLEKFGFAKELKKLSKDLFYFSQQVNEYREIFKDSKKAERKALELLSKLKPFRDFMRKNSVLASLFRIGDPNDPANLANLAGLQTRAQVNSLIQSQIAAGGPGAQQQFSQNLQAAQSQLHQLKDKINKWGGGSSDDVMPEGFKPNANRSKKFISRFSIGTDFQTTKHNNLFPVGTDAGLFISYPLNANSHISIGSSFKIGWGSGFNHIRLSSQGVAIRAGLDWRLKGNLFIAGKYEQNYFSEIRNISQLSDYSSWKTAALLGISKKYKTGKKRSGQMSLLYDFFYNRPPVKTQPIVLRVAFNFKND